QHDEFRALSGGKCPVRAGNGDFEIGRAKVTARVGDWLNRPLLLGLTHVVAHANVNVTRRPFRRNLSDILCRARFADACEDPTSSTGRACITSRPSSSHGPAAHGKSFHGKLESSPGAQGFDLILASL